jgi:glycosyltransferase involved in cell wall biosynthesis
MNPSIDLNIVILTFNSEKSLKDVILSCQSLTSNIFVVDSYSSDTTISIAKSFNCQVVQHHFENYSQQRNWAQEYIKQFSSPNPWLLHLDSDEVISSKLVKNIQKFLNSSEASKIDGCLIQRQSFFLGKPIRFGHTNPSWHLRLFQASKGKCEDRLYDQHFIVPGKTQKIEGLLLDLQLTTIEQWTSSHNRWSTSEAREIIDSFNQSLEIEKDVLPASLYGDLRMQKRWLKNNLYYQSPILLRAFIFFFYSYFIKLGFLDGKTGLIYHILQAFWFRFLTDAKIIEQEIEKATK